MLEGETEGSLLENDEEDEAKEEEEGDGHFARNCVFNL